MKSSQNNTPKNNKKPGNKWIKPVCITAVVLAIVIAAAVILPNVLGGKEENTRITTYTISKVTYDNITQTISGSGTITPVTSETLTSTKGGEVEKVNFTVGDAVAEDDVIAVINGENIVAPCDGVLLELPLNVGDEVAQGGSVAMVMGKDGFTMGIAVDETEISSVKLDQEVTFTIDAVNSDFTGKVTKISYNGSSSGGSVAYQITAAFDFAEGLYPGMSATAQIVIEDSGEGLMVPVDAITTSGDNNYLYLAPSGAEEGTIYEEDQLDLSKLTKISVKTGMSDGSYILVESESLQEGDLIVITKITSTQTGSDKESERGSFPGGMSGMPNMPGGMDFGDFDFENFDPGQRPEGGFGGFGN
jgi:HlyD family secretion protein